MANLITLLRVMLAFNALFIAKISTLWNSFAILLIIISLLLDAIDGYIARQLNTSTLKGSIYDILADRIIENIFFIYFATMSLFSVWFAIIMLVRGLTIDAIRTIYAFSGKTAFGLTTFHKKKWAYFFTCSRISRGLYNTTKIFTFVCFTALLIPDSIFANLMEQQSLQNISFSFLCLTVFLALVRAIPVVFEGLVNDT